MKERLERLKILLEELRDHSYSDQHGLADHVETNPKLKERMNTLASESEFYQNILDKIDNLYGNNSTTTKPHLGECKHENVTMSDGLAECTDCGTRNF